MHNKKEMSGVNRQWIYQSPWWKVLTTGEKQMKNIWRFIVILGVKELRLGWVKYEWKTQDIEDY